MKINKLNLLPSLTSHTCEPCKSTGAQVTHHACQHVGHARLSGSENPPCVSHASIPAGRKPTMHVSHTKLPEGR